MTIKSQAVAEEVIMCNNCNQKILKCQKCLDFFFDLDEIYCKEGHGKVEHVHCVCEPDEKIKDGKKK